MDERKEKVILFRITVDQRSGGFSHASNFITKVFNKEPVTVEDVKGIRSRLVPKERSLTESKARLLLEGRDFCRLQSLRNYIRAYRELCASLEWW